MVLILREFLAGRVVLHEGDCFAILQTLDGNSVDSVVTDPPYHLTSIVKRFAGANDKSQLEHSAGKDLSTINAAAFKRLSKGFMGKQWDGGDIAFRVEVWAEALRVLKPGGHMVAFSGTRTYHRMVCAIEDAGFEIRDQLAWVFGSGFPKSHNAGNGWGTALKPAWEPICLARKPLSEATVAANVLRWGTGAINVDGCRIPKANGDRREYGVNGDEPSLAGAGASGTMGRVAYEPDARGRWPANLCHDGGEEALRYFYTAKADGDDRLGSKHPTVKPLDLMQWLCRLVTPTGGVVLDPFAGTGTTGEAAYREGFRAVLIEREAEYQDDIARRMALVLDGPVTRKNASTKARGREAHAGPLFAEGGR